MNDQRRHHTLQRVPGQHPSHEEVWESEPDGEDSLIEDEVWPPRLPTSTRRYHYTAHAVPPGTALVRTTAMVGGRMQGVPARRSALPPRRSEAGQAWPPPSRVEREPSPPPPRQCRERLRLYWSLWLGIGMLIMTLGWLALGVLGSWWQTTQDDWHYGYPRTFQADAVVGHNHDAPAHPSHFLALNLSRHILVIELPAGDPSCSARGRSASRSP